MRESLKVGEEGYHNISQLGEIFYQVMRESLIQYLRILYPLHWIKYALIPLIKYLICQGATEIILAGDSDSEEMEENDEGEEEEEEEGDDR